MGSRVRWGYLAGGWAVAFALVHLYWAAGGTVGLDVSAGAALAEQRPGWFVVGGLVGVGAALLVVGAAAIVLERGRVRLLQVLCWATAVLLLVRGLGLAGLLLAGVVRVGGGVSAEQIAWTWWLWNPWFVVGGVCFALVSGNSGRGPSYHSRVVKPRQYR